MHSEHEDLHDLSDAHELRAILSHPLFAIASPTSGRALRLRWELRRSSNHEDLWCVPEVRLREVAPYSPCSGKHGYGNVPTTADVSSRGERSRLGRRSRRASGVCVHALRPRGALSRAANPSGRSFRPRGDTKRNPAVSMMTGALQPIHSMHQDLHDLAIARRGHRRHRSGALNLCIKHPTSSILCRPGHPNSH
jgi:hypothetical protein